MIMKREGVLGHEACKWSVATGSERQKTTFHAEDQEVKTPCPVKRIVLARDEFPSQAPSRAPSLLPVSLPVHSVG